MKLAIIFYFENWADLHKTINCFWKWIENKVTNFQTSFKVLLCGKILFSGNHRQRSLFCLGRISIVTRKETMEPYLCNYDNSGHMRYFPFAVYSKWLLYEHKLKLHSFAVYKKQAVEGTTSSFSLLINFYEQQPFFKATL